MQIQILVDAEAFWSSLHDDIHASTEYVYLQSLSYEGDRVGKAMSQLMLESPAPDRRVIADDFYTRHKINDKSLHNPKNWFNDEIRRERDETLAMMRHLEASGVRVKLTNPSGWFQLRVLHRNHKKIIAIDDRVAYIGGMNFSDHNFEWHDMMLRIDDAEATRFLKDDFLATWKGQHRSGSRRFENIEIFSFDGHNNRRSFRPIFDLIENARESVYVLSPYITYPFFEKLTSARRNGAAVTLITPEMNNWPNLKEYSQWRSIQAGIGVRLYQERMMHLKAMLIDDTHLIVGSSNFDFLSFHFLQEIVAVVTDAETVSQFKQEVLAKDLDNSVPSQTTVSDARGYYHHTRLKMLSWLSRSVGRVVP